MSVSWQWSLRHWGDILNLMDMKEGTSRANYEWIQGALSSAWMSVIRAYDGFSAIPQIFFPGFFRVSVPEVPEATPTTEASQESQGASGVTEIYKEQGDNRECSRLFTVDRWGRYWGPP